TRKTIPPGSSPCPQEEDQGQGEEPGGMVFRVAPREFDGVGVKVKGQQGDAHGEKEPFLEVVQAVTQRCGQLGGGFADRRDLPGPPAVRLRREQPGGGGDFRRTLLPTVLRHLLDLAVEVVERLTDVPELTDLLPSQV